MNEPDRNIVHLDVPDFYTALEELRRPELKRGPLILAEPGPRTVVRSVNENARKEGILEGMPLIRARRLCGKLKVIPPDFGFYQERHVRIVRELGRFSPRVEGAFPGCYFIDLTGTQRLLGAPADVACRLEDRLADEMSLQGRAGLGGNKLISRVAAHSIVPGDLCRVFPGSETSFLAPMPVTVLPGIGPKVSSRLEDFNIRLVGGLASIPPEDLSLVFGRAGDRLSRLARGIDPAPVIPFEQVPRLRLVRNLKERVMELPRLESILFQQVEEAGWILRRHNRIPGEAVLETRYADGAAAREKRRLVPVSTHLDLRLFLTLQPALEALVKRRVAVQRIILELSRFSMPFRQMALFSMEEPEAERERSLQTALDHVRRRFGPRAVSWGRTLADR